MLETAYLDKITMAIAGTPDFGSPQNKSKRCCSKVLKSNHGRPRVITSDDDSNHYCLPVIRLARE